MYQVFYCFHTSSCLRDPVPSVRCSTSGQLLSLSSSFEVHLSSVRHMIQHLTTVFPLMLCC
ncbi:hypothetical protein BT69DRAFT_1286429 [Atractiella rhizophila]|nr:hypothetical protein BT69DRAFT_1289500 [Atractiella rhizophila]KAH8917652.1 hypothetical protein BT69DRAFT_1286429 [Atractiella rhizophila]